MIQRLIQALREWHLERRVKRAKRQLYGPDD